MRLDRMLANLGYGSRREVVALFRAGRVTRADGTPVGETDRAGHGDLRFDGEPLDPPAPLTLVMHKPLGVTCSHDDLGPLIYELLPTRYRRRQPALSSVGRLDKETSGMLLLTDDGALLHRLTSPKKAVWKTYDAILARPLDADAAKRLIDGGLLLEGDARPCLPARLAILSERAARVSIVEGRYHQVRRMFAAVGNHVESLHRVSVGALTLGDLVPGQWREATPADLAAVEQRTP